MKELGVALGCLVAALALTALLNRADPWLCGGLLGLAVSLARWALEDA